MMDTLPSQPCPACLTPSLPLLREALLEAAGPGPAPATSHQASYPALHLPDYDLFSIHFSPLLKEQGLSLS